MSRRANRRKPRLPRSPRYDSAMPSFLSYPRCRARSHVWRLNRSLCACGRLGRLA